MKVYEKNFRETYKQICLLTGAEILEKIKLRDIFDYPVEDEMQGFITYGYIDENTGFNFKVLAGAQIDGDKIKVFPASYKKSVAVRRATKKALPCVAQILKTLKLKFLPKNILPPSLTESKLLKILSPLTPPKKRRATLKRLTHCAIQISLTMWQFIFTAKICNLKLAGYAVLKLKEIY